MKLFGLWIRGICSVYGLLLAVLVLQGFQAVAGGIELHGDTILRNGCLGDMFNRKEVGQIEIHDQSSISERLFDVFPESVLKVFTENKPEVLVFYLIIVRHHDIEKGYYVIINNYGEREVIERVDPELYEYLSDDQSGLTAHSENQEHGIDLSMVMPFDYMHMGIIMMAGDDDKKQAEQKSEGAEGAGEGTKNKDSSVDEKKTGVSRKKTSLTIAIDPGQKRKRLLTCALSIDSQKGRAALSGEGLLKEKELMRLSLENVDLDRSAIIAGQGHRLLVSIKFINASRKWVLKLTDDGVLDKLQKYESDLTLVTFNQALPDVNAFLLFKNTFLNKFNEHQKTTLFPETRIALISFSEYVNLIDQLIKNNNTNSLDEYELLRRFSSVDDSLHSGFIFIIIQEFIDGLRGLTDSDNVSYIDQINYICANIKDVSSDGSNLMIQSCTDNLVVIDIEKDQLGFCFFTSENDDSEESTDPIAKACCSDLETVDAIVFEPLAELAYKTLAPVEFEKICRAVSSDSGIGSVNDGQNVVDEESLPEPVISDEHPEVFSDEEHEIREDIVVEHALPTQVNHTLKQ